MNAAATSLALLAILIWSFSGFLISHLGHVPPFLQVGITLSIAGVSGLLRWRAWRMPWKTLAVGVGGIFGNLFFYYTAFKHAPVIEANLMNYLWPLLIVLLTPLFVPGARLRPHHVLGALLGLAGTWLILSGGALNLQRQYLPGYLSAAAGALTWAVYSLALKRLPPFQDGATGAFCLCSGILSLAIFFWQQPAGQALPALSAADWMYMALTGIGPCAVAYLCWGAAMKRGDPRVLGALSYLTPLSSTLVLVVLGNFRLSPVSFAAMLLIVGGAVLGSWTALGWGEKRLTPGVS